MANKHRSEVGFEADDKSWTMKFSTNVICEMEDHFDCSIQTLGDRMETESSMRMTREVFRFGLSEHHPELTVDQAGALMDEVGAAAAGEKIGQAFKLAFPEVEKKQNPRKATGR